MYAIQGLVFFFLPLSREQRFRNFIHQYPHILITDLYHRTTECIFPFLFYFLAPVLLPCISQNWIASTIHQPACEPTLSKATWVLFNFLVVVPQWASWTIWNHLLVIHVMYNAQTSGQNGPFLVSTTNTGLNWILSSPVKLTNFLKPSDNLVK